MAGVRSTFSLIAAEWTQHISACTSFPGGSVVKNLPAIHEAQEVWVQYLGQENPLEEGKATHSSIAAWRIPWTEEPGGLHSPWNCRVGPCLRFSDCFSFETAEGCVCPKSLICECEHRHFRGKSSHIARAIYVIVSAFPRWWLCTGVCWFLVLYVCTHGQAASRCMNNNNKDAVNSNIKKENYYCNIIVSIMCEQWLATVTTLPLGEKLNKNRDLNWHQELPLRGAMLDSQTSFTVFERKCSFLHFTLGKPRPRYQKGKN